MLVLVTGSKFYIFDTVIALHSFSGHINIRKCERDPCEMLEQHHGTQSCILTGDQHMLIFRYASEELNVRYRLVKTSQRV